MKKRRLFFLDIFFVLLTLGLAIGCSNLSGNDNQSNFITPSTLPDKIVITANLYSSQARTAMPDSMQDLSTLVYTASLGNSTLVEGSYESGTVSFTFATPATQTGLSFEIFAFASGSEIAKANAALYWTSPTTIDVSSGTISVDKVFLVPYTDSTKKGSVLLSIKVPAGCTLTCNDTTNFIISGTVPNYTLKGTEITAGAYTLVFSVKKGLQNVYSWIETINVYPGMNTNKWINDLSADDTKEITSEEISSENISTFYVLGTDSKWYSQNLPSVNVEPNNNGTLMKPLGTVKAVLEKIKDKTDKNRPFTIYVDGTITAASVNDSVLNFSTLDEDSDFTIVVKSLSLEPSKKATLKGNGAIVVSLSAREKLNLTLENLNIDGNDKNIGLYTYKGKITLNNCKIFNCNSPVIGFVILGYGGGIYSEEADVLLNDCELTNNKATKGGAIWAKNTTLNIDGCTINNNTASQSGSGICTDSEVIITLSGECNISNDIYFVKPSDPQKPSESLQLNVNAETFALASGAGKIPITPNGFNTGDVIVKTTDSSNLINAFTVTNNGYKINYSGANGVLAELASGVKTPEQAIDALNNAPANSGSIDLNINIDSPEAFEDLYNALHANSSKFPDGVSLTISGSNGIDEIDGNKFNSIGCLKSVEITDGITSIGEGAFSNCTGLTSVTLPESLTTIGERAFSQCTALTELEIPEGVEEIKTQAFSDCTALKTIKLPKSLLRMAPRAFSCCTVLEQMIFGNKTGWYVSNSGYTDGDIIEVADSTTAAGYFNDNSSPYINSYWHYKAATVMSVDDAIAALQAASNGATVEINMRVTSESDLTTLVTAMESNTSKYVSLTIAEDSSISKIPANLFYSSFSAGSYIKAITIPSCITSIGESAFEDCSNLESVTLPDTLESIGISAFNYCTSLTSIIIPSSVKTIGERAFASAGITSAVFKNTENWSVEKDNVKTNINVGNATTNAENLTDISKYALHTWSRSITMTTTEAADKLDNANSGDTIELLSVSTTSASDALSLLAKIKEAESNGVTITSLSVEIPFANNVSDLANFFYNFSQTNVENLSIDISDGTTRITDNFSGGASKVVSVIAPASVETVSNSAFSENTKLETVVFNGSTAPTIGTKAFYYCTGLKSITFKSPTPPASIGTNAFLGTKNTLVIYVPSGSKSDYETALTGTGFTGSVVEH